MISHSQKGDVWASLNISIWILVCSLENLYFQSDEIISTRKLSFNNPLVKNITTFLAYFFFRL